MSPTSSSFEKQSDQKPTDLSQIRSEAMGEVDISYHDQQKYNLLLTNDAVEKIGMGRYQWQMCFTCGFGFIVDQVCHALVTC